MDFFTSLAVVLGVAAIGGILAKVLRQPAIIGYILAGIVISFFHILRPGQNDEMIRVMGQLGVTLLLFLVGLELPLSELTRMGKTASITGIGQIVTTSIIGFGITRLLGFDIKPALFLAIAVSFGSTVIVVNILSKKKDLQSLYGRTAVGLLLIQDFIAIGVMVVLSGITQSSFSPWSLVWVMVKGLGLVSLAAWASNKILPKFLDWFGQHTDILFIVSLGWCLMIAAVVASPWIGFTVELGGFLAGLTLANAAQNLQIVSRIRPLRDFFITLFFVGLGANISFANIGQLIWPALALSALVLIGNPVILMVILGWQGYKKRIAFLTGITVSQVSEFSLIVLTMAASVGYVSSSLVSLVAIVALTTMLVSSYLITHAETIYRHIHSWLIFPTRKTLAGQTSTATPPFGEIVLFGHNRIGKMLRPALEKLGKSLLIIDFDPAILESLHHLGVSAVYGDISDYELYEELNMASSKLIISTVSDINDNLQLLRFIKTIRKNRPAVVVLATDNADAEVLYRSGADYVLVPHTVGGAYLSEIIKVCGVDRELLAHRGQEMYNKLTYGK